MQKSPYYSSYWRVNYLEVSSIQYLLVWRRNPTAIHPTRDLEAALL